MSGVWVGLVTGGGRSGNPTPYRRLLGVALKNKVLRARPLLYWISMYEGEGEGRRNVSERDWRSE